MTAPTITDKGQIYDLGSLVLEDGRAADELNAKKMLERTKENFCALYQQLFDLKKQESEQHPDGEFMEYTKSKYLVALPDSKIVLPREKHIPKAKPLTKWEKFRLQKGLTPRKKRSLLVFDEITNDWVPRWGPYSKKKIEEKADWVKELKPHHEAQGIDPFTETKQKKKMVVAKEKLKQIKNQLWAAKEVEKTAREASKGAFVAPKDDGEKVEKPADKKVSFGGKEEKQAISKPEKFELKQ